MVRQDVSNCYLPSADPKLTRSFSSVHVLSLSLYIGHPHSVFFLLCPFIFLTRIVQQDILDPQSPLYACFFQQNKPDLRYAQR